MFSAELFSQSISAFLCWFILPLLLFAIAYPFFFGDVHIKEVKKQKTLFFLMFVSCYVGVGCWRAYKVWGEVDWVGVLALFLPTSFWHIAGSLLLAFLYHFQEKYKIDL